MRNFANAARSSFASIAMILIAACSAASQAANYTMFRNPNCGCCLAWAEHIKQGKKDAVTTVDHPDMMTLKSQHGVPDDLRSCHTMIAEGYVIEGHVPAADLERLLAERPDWIVGLAVAGMPLGSPGMEAGGKAEPYQVIAFGNGRREVFADYR